MSHEQTTTLAEAAQPTPPVVAELHEFARNKNYDVTKVVGHAMLHGTGHAESHPTQAHAADELLKFMLASSFVAAKEPGVDPNSKTLVASKQGANGTTEKLIFSVGKRAPLEARSDASIDRTLHYNAVTYADDPHTGEPTHILSSKSFVVLPDGTVALQHNDAQQTLTPLGHEDVMAFLQDVKSFDGFSLPKQPPQLVSLSDALHNR